MADRAQGKFTVAHHPDVRTAWRRWRQQAARAGILDEYLAALRRLAWRLTNEATDWGEPFQNLHALDMVGRRGVEWFFVAIYSVNEEKRFVYLQNVKLLPNNPLE